MHSCSPSKLDLQILRCTMIAYKGRLCLCQGLYEGCVRCRLVYASEIASLREPSSAPMRLGETRSNLEQDQMAKTFEFRQVLVPRREWGAPHLSPDKIASH